MRNTNRGGLYRHPNNAALKVVTDTPATPGLIRSSPNLMALPTFDKRVGLGRIAIAIRIIYKLLFDSRCLWVSAQVPLIRPHTNSGTATE